MQFSLTAVVLLAASMVAAAPLPGKIPDSTRLGTEANPRYRTPSIDYWDGLSSIPPGDWGKVKRGKIPDSKQTGIETNPRMRTPDIDYWDGMSSNPPTDWKRAAEPQRVDPTSKSTETTTGRVGEPDKAKRGFIEAIVRNFGEGNFDILEEQDKAVVNEALEQGTLEPAVAEYLDGHFDGVVTTPIVLEPGLEKRQSDPLTPLVQQIMCWASPDCHLDRWTWKPTPDDGSAPSGGKKASGGS